MVFIHQEPLHNPVLEDDPNQSFDASSYINDDGDSPEPFDNLEADPLSSETDSGVHDMMQDVDAKHNLNHFLNHSSSGNPGAITFVSDDLTRNGATFGTGLTGLTPGMEIDNTHALSGDYGLGVNMRVVGSENPGDGLGGNIDGSSNEDVEALSAADMTPRACKVTGKAGTRSMDQQRYAAAMKQHHHANSSTSYATPLLAGRTADAASRAVLAQPPMTTNDALSQQMTTSASERHVRGPQHEMAPSPIFSHVAVKREPTEAGTDDLMVSGAAPHAITGVPLQIQTFDRYEAEDGQEEDDDEGTHGLAEVQDGHSVEERSSDSSVHDGRSKKRKDKGKEKEPSSGLEIDETDVGMTAELDPAGDGDGDDENARRKIKIEYIEDKSRRHITFSKRKAGIMKKAYELSILTGTQVLLLVVSETGLCYTYTTPKMSPMVTQPAGQQLIQACLNAPEGYGPDGEVLKVPSAPSGSKKDKNELAIRPLKLNAEELANLAAASASASDPTTPKKKKQGKPTLEGKESKPGGAAAAQNRRRASDKVKRAASGAAKKGPRVTSEGNPASSGARSYSEHDMDSFHQPPPIPPIPANIRRNPSNTATSIDGNGSSASVLMQHNPQPDIQPGVSLVSPISAAFPTSHALSMQHHQTHHHAQQNDYSEYHMHQAQATGPHYYQAQAISQPQPGGLAPVQINYSYPTSGAQYIDPASGGSALHSQQMQRRQSQHQSMSQPPHSAEPHLTSHQHYVQSLGEAQQYSTAQPHPNQMVAGSISMGGQI